MFKNISLQEALEIWENQREEIKGKNKFHPKSVELFKFAQGIDTKRKEYLINHMIYCSECRNKWIEYMMNEASDDYFYSIIIPKVAGQEVLNNVTKIYSDCGQFLITCRKKNYEIHSYLIKLEILKDSTFFNGRKLIVYDKNGTKLLYGKVIKNKISGWIRTKKIDFSFLTIIEGD